MHPAACHQRSPARAQPPQRVITLVRSAKHVRSRARSSYASARICCQLLKKWCGLCCAVCRLRPFGANFRVASRHALDLSCFALGRLFEEASNPMAARSLCVPPSARTPTHPHGGKHKRARHAVRAPSGTGTLVAPRVGSLCASAASQPARIVAVAASAMRRTHGPSSVLRRRTETHWPW